MNWRRIAIGTVVLGVVANALDYVLNTYLLAGLYASMSDIMNPTPNMAMFIVGDFAGAFMLMLAWDKVGSAFGKGPAAGAKFGAAAGLFITFPLYLFFQMMLKGLPYSATWIMIGVLTVFYAILGTIAAVLDRSTSS